MTGHPVSWPQNVASARGSAQSNVTLRMEELMLFSALSRAPTAGVSGRREARESHVTSTAPPFLPSREEPPRSYQPGLFVTPPGVRALAAAGARSGCQGPPAISRRAYSITAVMTSLAWLRGFDPATSRAPSPIDDVTTDA